MLSTGEFIGHGLLVMTEFELVATTAPAQCLRLQSYILEIALGFQGTP
jgi:hypothetical protein